MPTPSDLFLSPDLTEEQARAYLQSLGFRDAAATDEHLQGMADDLVVREALGRLAPDLLPAVLESPDPDAAVAAIARYVASRSGRGMFLDYLRELRQDSFPFPRGHKILVEGLEDVLLAAGNSLSEVEGRIHSVLTSRANELESIMGTNVQMVFKDKLQKSDDFWLEAGMQKHLSLRRIFGTPRRYRSASGTEFFIVGFNLT